MPHQLDAVMTLDDFEDEILFTRAALQADPDATDFLPNTQDWLGRVDAVRAKERKAREVIANTDATRAVTNVRLDKACVSLGDDLLASVKKDRTSARWRQFFRDLPVSQFIRQALDRQVSTVRGWLGASQDPVLEKHRAELERWTQAAEAALDRTRGSSAIRGEAWVGREELAEALTRERDGLHDALSGRARERDLPRDWADLFFRVERRSKKATPPTTGSTSADSVG